MKATEVAAVGGQRTFVLVLDPSEEAFATITRFAVERGLEAASLSAIGAFERATVGWFDLEAKTYRPIEVNEQCEALCLLGTSPSATTASPACTSTASSACGMGRRAAVTC
jgi:hypothetical protein